MNIVFSPIISEKLKRLMVQKYRITDTGSSGMAKFLKTALGKNVVRLTVE